jgi:hypothetical protein
MSPLPAVIVDALRAVLPQGSTQFHEPPLQGGNKYYVQCSK